MTWEELNPPLLVLKTEEGATSQGVLVASSSWTMQENGFELRAPKGVQPWLWYYPSETVKILIYRTVRWICVILSHQFCYSSNRKLMKKHDYIPSSRQPNCLSSPPHTFIFVWTCNCATGVQESLGYIFGFSWRHFLKNKIHIEF